MTSSFKSRHQTHFWAGSDKVICRGKRKGVYGSYLLAIYSEDTEEFQTISKIGTGFSEEQLISLSAHLNTFTIPSPPSYYK